ncbi:hypothetical protein DFH07DRAFT_950936 [Mycena maculata]|uniref:Uncharacterized protein n=1 Tax=Mycena maculata TaxID=230809 RepID=A0AAD7K5W4_9AGAR|nr:hypothetical protein DFH07DRAFT_950936 [Mycena maculata]
MNIPQSLKFCINAAVHNELESTTFSVGSPAIVQEVWDSVQEVPDLSVLIGDHVLRTCFLSLMLKRDLAGPSGFFTTVRDLVLTPDVYAALITKAGLQWRGPSERPAADAFLIFVAALHTSLDDFPTFLDWFRQTFLPLIQAAEASHVQNVNQEGTFHEDSSHATYSRTLDIIGQIKLIWSASTLAGKELTTITGAALSPVLRIAGHTLRASVPPKWIRSRKLTETLRRKRPVSSIFDPRPSPSSSSRVHVLDSEAAFSPPPTEAPSSPPEIAVNTAPHFAPSLQTAMPLASLSASDPQPFRCPTSVRRKQVSALTPLRLPHSYDLHEPSSLHSSRRDFF